MRKEEIRAKLKDKTVGIAGCGGLGSNCAMALARAGLGRLIIADFDVVDESNLNRQYYFYDQIGKKKVDALRDNIMRIDPKIKIITHDIQLDAENIKSIFANCDAIVEAFDLAEMKEMIIETILEYFPQIFIISGVGLAGWGKNNTITTRNTGNLYICGDLETEVSEELPPLAPRVGIVANMQANQLLELLLS